MSIKLMTAIFETEFRDLHDAEGNITKASTAKLVLLAMADHANDDGEGIYPSLETLCTKTALSAQTIRNTWDALIYNGLAELVGSSKYGTKNHKLNPLCYPKMRGEDDTRLTLYPLYPSTGLTPPLQPVPFTPQPVRPEPSLTTIKPPLPQSIENAIYTGQHVTEEMAEQAKLRDVAPKQFENALGFSKALGWWNGKDWTDFAEWVCQIYAEDRAAFGRYNIWRNTPYTKGGMSNNRIRGFVREFYDSWDMFKMSEQEKVKTDDQRGEYQAFTDDRAGLEFVPNPKRPK